MEVFYPYWLSHMGTSWETFWHNWEIQLIIYLRLWKIQEVKFTNGFFQRSRDWSSLMLWFHP